MPGNPLTDPDWASNLAATIERTVGRVRDTTTTRAVLAVRALVFGIVIGLAGICALVLTIVLTLKLVQRLVNFQGWIDADSSVWVSYLLLAALLAVAGAFCMRLRTVKGDR